MAESTLSLFGILALLGLWLFHQVQVRTGRILAIDLFDRSVVRLYLYVLPDDRTSCPVCVQAHGRVFLPAVVGKAGFSALDGSCSGAVPCQGLLVGLYGGWAEARQLVNRVHQASKKHPVRLSSEEVCELVKERGARASVPTQTASACVCSKDGALGTLIGPRPSKDCGMWWSVRRRRGMLPTLFRPLSG